MFALLRNCWFVAITSKFVLITRFLSRAFVEILCIALVAYGDAPARERGQEITQS